MSLFNKAYNYVRIGPNMSGYEVCVTSLSNSFALFGFLLSFVGRNVIGPDGLFVAFVGDVLTLVGHCVAIVADSFRVADDVQVLFLQVDHEIAPPNLSVE
ncbi:hypothetical protein EVAR_8094_1 [Eumeta japonica]|uniref:Uncharacterized protein n=1 Tax=Eumeta variegata TaxID=151549 RepID=A0A4C1TSM9_EUMVA|nr:hypothetical protein EVAR_8094_1 [Eumeta japonica]